MRYANLILRANDETNSGGNIVDETVTPETTTVPAAAQAAPVPAATTTATAPTVKPSRVGKRLSNLTAKPVAAKPATKTNVKPSAKIKAVKPDATKPAKPAAVSSDRADARAAAKLAVRAYYGGASLPFKAAVDLPHKADLNPALQSRPTERTAALIAAIIAYCELSPDGTFVRGSGRVPGKLLGRTGADGEKLFAAGPESGCTSNMLGAQIVHVSGPHGGKQAADTKLRITNAAIENLIAFNVSSGDGKPRRFTAVLALARKTLSAERFPALNTGANIVKPAKPASTVASA